MRTWHLEAALVAFVLCVVLLATNGRGREMAAAVCVLLTFLHAQVADRMAEAEERRGGRDVACYRLSRWYFVTKEAGWAGYFAATGAWPALFGCGLFIAYPLWRRWYRRNA